MSCSACFAAYQAFIDLYSASSTSRAAKLSRSNLCRSPYRPAFFKCSVKWESSYRESDATGFSGEPVRAGSCTLTTFSGLTSGLTRRRSVAAPATSELVAAEPGEILKREGIALTAASAARRIMFRTLECIDCSSDSLDGRAYAATRGPGP